MPTLKHVKEFITNPAMAKQVGQYLVNDINAIFGRYPYPYRTIFIAGLPKSGTTWLSSMLTKVPGYNLRRIHDPRGITVDHDICDSVFAALPDYGYSIVKLHTHYSPENYKVITKHVPKFVVMHRDLRDMCVSRYFHVKAEKEHRHHEMYNACDLDDGMAHAIEVVREYYLDWVKDWHEQIKKHPDVILPVAYKDLNTETAETLRRVSDFFELSLDPDLIESLVQTKIKKQTDLKETFDKKLPRLVRSTARKGRIGEWRKYFNDRNKQTFKDMAGNILIELGYEKDRNW